MKPARRVIEVYVPPGEHQIAVSYLGLDSKTPSVVVTTGQRAVRKFALTSSVYGLDAVNVQVEREAHAAALMEQRNASNLKIVATVDSFGQLPLMSSGEIFPGCRESYAGFTPLMAANAGTAYVTGWELASAASFDLTAVRAANLGSSLFHETLALHVRNLGGPRQRCAGGLA